MRKNTRIIILFVISCLFLSSCVNGNKDTVTADEDIPVAENMDINSQDGISMPADNTIVDKHSSELLQTGEFVTADQMKALETEAIGWQSAKAGVGGIATIVAIDLQDGSGQQVFINFTGSNIYEKIQIKVSLGTQARLISASSGAGSGEIEIGYKFVSENDEWVELFRVFYPGELAEENTLQWQNITESQSESIQILNKLPPDKRQFN